MNTKISATRDNEDHHHKQNQFHRFATATPVTTDTVDGDPHH
jgi:hypothetical protein